MRLPVDRLDHGHELRLVLAVPLPADDLVDAVPRLRDHVVDHLLPLRIGSLLLQLFSSFSTIVSSFFRASCISVVTSTS